MRRRARHRPSQHRLLCRAALVGLVFATGACDDAFIDPFDNDERYYTIYGFLDEAKNFEPGAEHTVRVIPITRFAERITSPTDDQAFIDAVVTSTDVRTGASQRWEHSLEKLDDGTYGHIFRTDLFVLRGRTYRLEVRRSDGVVATAETKVPNAGSIEIDFGDPRVDGESGAVTQDVVLARAPSPWNIEVTYRIGDPTCFSGSPQTLFYGRVGAPMEDDGWRFTINLTEDLDRLIQENVLVPGVNTLCSMSLRVGLLDGKWTPPEGIFDPEVLAQPGVLSNVENGYGFWGSIGLYQHDWVIGDELRGLLGL